MGRAETVIVMIKLAILAIFIVAAFTALSSKGSLDSHQQIGRARWASSRCRVVVRRLRGIWVDHERRCQHGQTQADIARAIYGSVAIVIVIYLLVSVGVVTNVPLGILKGLGDSALAVAAKPSWPSGLQADRRGRAPLDGISRQRDVVRLNEHRLSNRQERSAPACLRPQALGPRR